MSGRFSKRPKRDGGEAQHGAWKEVTSGVYQSKTSTATPSCLQIMPRSRKGCKQKDCEVMQEDNQDLW